MKYALTIPLSAVLLSILVAVSFYFCWPQLAAAADEITRIGGPMKHSLSKRLSPMAKKAILRGPEDKIITGHLQVGPKADIEMLKQTLVKLGVKYGAWNSETYQLRIDAPVGQLNTVAELKDVIYFEVATRYSH